MSRSDIVYLQDILESINFITQYLGDKTAEEFKLDMMLQDAVIRRFEIIGEASSKISEGLKQYHPEVEWQLMKAMRNKLVHEYYGVSADTIYATITTDIPQLKIYLENILDQF